MRSKVTEQGVVIPRELLEGVEEVETRKEDGRVVVIPSPPEDPIWGLGRHPVRCGASGASENHDRYLYGPNP